jgi:hypothetical protein
MLRLHAAIKVIGDKVLLQKFSTAKQWLLVLDVVKNLKGYVK